MKRFFLSLIILIFFSVNSYSQITYIDINFILNTSEVGKSLNKYIKDTSNKYLIDYNEIENNLIKKEKELVAQQNIIEKNEFKIKLSNLSKEINKYRSDKKQLQESIKKIKLDNTKKILKILNPIITEYVDTNSISLVIPKKILLLGRKI